MKNKKISSIPAPLLNVSINRPVLDATGDFLNKVNHPLLHESTAPNQ
jgi:hypothetical protein